MGDQFIFVDSGQRLFVLILFRLITERGIEKVILFEGKVKFGQYTENKQGYHIYLVDMMETAHHIFSSILDGPLEIKVSETRFPEFYEVKNVEGEPIL